MRSHARGPLPAMYSAMYSARLRSWGAVFQGVWGWGLVKGVWVKDGGTGGEAHARGPLPECTPPGTQVVQLGACR